MGPVQGPVRRSEKKAVMGGEREVTRGLRMFPERVIERQWRKKGSSVVESEEFSVIIWNLRRRIFG